jgi:hypothetical protein
MTTDYFAEQLFVTRLTPAYVSLHHDDPGVSGAYASEIIGITRCLIVWTEPVAKVIWNSTPIIFTGLPATIATHMGMWDATLNGNLLLAEELPKQVFFTAGASYRMEPYSLAVSVE